MTRFSADWLALREPYDARARNSDVFEALAAAVADLGSLAIVDLGLGRRRDAARDRLASSPSPTVAARR